MDNQRLTVEIVTDNRSVTEALRQNHDSLKETLAKQNIKMDSFNVTTGGSGQESLFGGNGRNQGVWQEMARSRQPASWQLSGYTLPAGGVAASIAQSSYSSSGLLDIHY